MSREGEASQGGDLSNEGRLELWGGIECTLARIGGAFRDQVAETGHRDRLEDIDLLAALGIRTLRYPVLWETVSPRDPAEADFTWHDHRLGRLQALGVVPIVGLCHHGSGPRYTDLLDPAWPMLLAQHAGRVARRYPHIDLYTPVNEPLTTARFAGLYGHWYPHGKSYDVFLPMLVNQCKATVLAMRAIRAVRLDAKLVLTDDFGKTFSTPALANQAAHENERRWLSFELIFGRVRRDHPWWSILRRNGVSESDLDLFLEGDAPPDILGINHYLTSERFLDERTNLYPEPLWGGNGHQDYADVEAVRMPLPPGDLGPAARLREVWDRYRRPIAITEAHHGCTRDEQVRWLVEVWRAAEAVRREGVDVRAVTVWSLFGTMDWNSLLTRRQGTYEPGPFDVRGPTPRPTALARASESLAQAGSFDHPVLDGPGWWKRDDRFYAPLRGPPGADRSARSARRILIAGAQDDALAAALALICEARGLDHAIARRWAGASVAESVRAALASGHTWAVVMTGDLNGAATLAVADTCNADGVPLVLVSSSRVFDGTLGRPYSEGDAPTATDPLGRQLAETECQILTAHQGALIVRAGPQFDPWNPHNFATRALNVLEAGESVSASQDIVSPTYVPDFVHEALNLLIDGVTGVWHLANPGPAPWEEILRHVARLGGYDEDRINNQLSSDPSNRALRSERGVLLPPLEGALERFFRDAGILRSRVSPRLAAE